jgi:hypothetical protein
MMHDGGGWHWGFGFAHWGFGILIWILILLVIAALVKYLFGSRRG